MRLLLLSVSLFLACAAGPLWAADPDPWVGKSRADLLALLGEPDKTKQSDEGLLLTFKLIRMAEGAIPSSGVRLLRVPGVKGTLGTMTPPGALVPGVEGVGAPEVDRYGRGTGGAVETEESYSVSWSKQEGVERSWQDKPDIEGKLTLKFTVNAQDEIVAWSVSPKKAAE